MSIRVKTPEGFVIEGDTPDDLKAILSTLTNNGAMKSVAPILHVADMESPALDASLADRLKALVSKADGDTIKFLLFLAKRPDSTATDKDVLAEFSWEPRLIGGLLRRLVNIATPLGIEFERHVVSRRSDRSGSERTYYYRISPELKDMLRQ